MGLTKRVKRIAAIGVLAGASVPAAFAILGLGDIVFDPTAVANLIQQLHQMEQQYVQLVETYRLVQSQYNQMLWMAQMVPAGLRAHYRYATQKLGPGSCGDFFKPVFMMKTTQNVR